MDSAVRPFVVYSLLSIILCLLLLLFFGLWSGSLQVPGPVYAKGLLDCKEVFAGSLVGIGVALQPASVLVELRDG